MQRNVVPASGPLSVRVTDSAVCNSLNLDDFIIGGSIFGRLQAALATDNAALALVEAGAPGLSHNPNSAALNLTAGATMFNTDATARNTAFRIASEVALDTGSDLDDIFRNAQPDLNPIEVDVFNNTGLSNIRTLSQSFRQLEEYGHPEPFVMSQIIRDITAAGSFQDTAGNDVAWADNFKNAMRDTMQIVQEAQASATRKLAKSSPMCATMPMKIRFVHDRLTVRPVTYTAYTVDAAGAGGTSRGRPCIPRPADVAAAELAYNTAVTAYDAPAQAAYLANLAALNGAGGALNDGSPEDVALQAHPSFALHQAVQERLQEFNTIKAHSDLGQEMRQRIIAEGGDALPDFTAFVFRHVVNGDEYRIVEDGLGDPVVGQTQREIRFVTTGTDNLGNNIFLTQGIPRYAPTDMNPGYAQPVYDQNFTANQHIEFDQTFGGLAGIATTTHCHFFTALADVEKFGVVDGDADRHHEVRTSVNLEPFYKRLSSIANAQSAAEYGTSDALTPVRIVNRVNAVASRSYYGYPYRGQAADQALTTAGLGDQILVPIASVSIAGGKLAIKDYTFVTAEGLRRYCYLFFSDVGRALQADGSKRSPTVVRFDMSQATLELRQQQNGDLADPYEMFTCSTNAEVYSPAAERFVALTAAAFAAIAANMPNVLANGGTALTHVLVQFDTLDFAENKALDNFGFADAIAQETGMVFRSRKRVSQPLCAPVLNPNVRIQCGPPLNFNSRHLPPEMRDFDLLLRDIDFSFLPEPTVGEWSLTNLRSFEFAGGNQVQTATDSLLYLPQFKLYEIKALNQTFDEIIYTSNGMPSYVAIYARYNEREAAQNFNLVQPRIESLNIACDTTKRKSNVVTDNMGKHHLFHLTMRNVHPASGYNSVAYNRRQIVLLSAEDIGLMSLKTSDYQSLRRVRFQFSGVCNQACTVSVVFVYNNRGLEIRGADIKVVRV